MAPADVHPNLADLEAFALGTLDHAALSTIAAHVVGCPTCQQRAAAAAPDSVVDLLRRAHVRSAAKNQAPGVARELMMTTPGALTGSSVGPATIGEEETEDDVVPGELAEHPRYQIVRRIGGGGMGTVYEAEHLVMQRRVALKVIKRSYLTSAGAVVRFEREVCAAARLSHQNIVTAHDAEHAGDRHFLVMEYVEGITLGRMVRERGPRPMAEACDSIRQAALGLQHAHESGMVHRDIKPDNLIRGPGGVVKVLDFGLAALTAEMVEEPLGNDAAADTPEPTVVKVKNSLTGAGVLLGTPEFMAPEQGENAHGTDIRADIYGLGATLYYLLTGEVPYPAPTRVLSILAHRERPVPSPCGVRPEVPPDLAAVVERMLAKMPEDRYQTPAEVATALEPFTVVRPASEFGAVAAPPAGVSSRRSRRRWRLMATVAALLLVGVAVAGGAVYRIQTDKGELVIKTESDDVEVVVKQRGELVRVIDTKTEKSITLHSGVYELELQGDPKGLKLTMEKATLMRGKTTLAMIEHIPKVSPTDATEFAKWPPAELPAKVGLLAALPVLTAASDFPILVSSDGRLFAQFHDTRVQWSTDTLDVIESATGKLMRKISVEGEKFTNATFTPDGKMMVTAHHNIREGFGFRLWNLEKGTGIWLDRVKDPGGWPCDLNASQDGRRVAYRIAPPNGDHLAEVVDTETGNILWRVPPTREKGFRTCYPVLSADGADVACATNLGDTNKGPWRQARLYLENLDRKKPKWDIDLPAGLFAESPFFDTRTEEVGVLLHDDSKTRFVGYWNVADSRKNHKTDFAMPTGGNIPPGGRWAIVGKEDHRLRVLALPSGREQYITDPLLQLQGGLVVAANGRLLVYRQAGCYHLYRLPDLPDTTAPKDAP